MVTSNIGTVKITEAQINDSSQEQSITLHKIYMTSVIKII